MKAISPVILVIDDEKNLLFGLQTVLRRAGYQVLIAASGREGLELVQTSQPDLIICDIMMPPPNGFDLFKILNQTPDTAAVPFLFLTARTAPADRIFGLELGAGDYLTKPFDVRELLARVHALLHLRQLNQQQGFERANRCLNEWNPRSSGVVIRKLLRREYAAKAETAEDGGGDRPPSSRGTP